MIGRPPREARSPFGQDQASREALHGAGPHHAQGPAQRGA